MAEEHTRVEIGLGIGQVLSVKLTESQIGELRKAVERGEGWLDLESQEGTVAINLGTVVYLRVHDSSHTIGFTG